MAVVEADAENFRRNHRADIVKCDAPRQVGRPAVTAAGEKAAEIALTLKRDGATVEQKVPAVGRSAFFKFAGEEKK